MDNMIHSLSLPWREWKDIDWPRHPMHLVQLTEHQHNLDAENERWKISARDSPFQAPLFYTSTWWSPLMLLKEEGMVPWNKFSLRQRTCNSWHPSIVLGIWPFYIYLDCSHKRRDQQEQRIGNSHCTVIRERVNQTNLTLLIECWPRPSFLWLIFELPCFVTCVSFVLSDRSYDSGFPVSAIS
jgi:hypothetical protein